MRKKIIYTIILVTFLLSCQSVPKSVDQTWTEEMFFKQAQESVDNNQVSTALFYYEVFLIRFPEDHAKVIEGFYRTKEDKASEERGTGLGLSIVK
nr:hypothetical protein [Oceanispirochaeta sp.]